MNILNKIENKPLDRKIQPEVVKVVYGERGGGWIWTFEISGKTKFPMNLNINIVDSQEINNCYLYPVSTFGFSFLPSTKVITFF